MIARLLVLLPFTVTLPEGEQFSVYEYIDEGYGIRVYPPKRSDAVLPAGGPDEIKINGVSAFQADALRIDFHRDSFARDKGGPCDPPERLMARAVNSFLLRLRHVTRSISIHVVNFQNITWRLQYLNDDETEFQEDEKLVRSRHTLVSSMSWVALDRTIWNDIHKLPLDYEPPPWEALLLDAYAELPRIGPAVVLAATALEVFIAQVLNQLATHYNIAQDVWIWINNRGNRLQNPSTEEQYSILLKYFTEFSLKDDKRLWEAFKNLKSARNSFVHEGLAKIGDKPIHSETAKALITSAWEIVDRIRESIPPELHWPEFRHQLQVQAVKWILPIESDVSSELLEAKQ